MKAKIKPDYRWNTARACGGAEFIKAEYRPVPPGREDEARRADFLVIEPEPAREPAPKPEVKKARKGKEQP